jgi:hypothetical protein
MLDVAEETGGEGEKAYPCKGNPQGWTTLGQRLNQNRLGALSVLPLDLLFQLSTS